MDDFIEDGGFDDDYDGGDDFTDEAPKFFLLFLQSHQPRDLPVENFSKALIRREDNRLRVPHSYLSHCSSELQADNWFWSGVERVIIPLFLSNVRVVRRFWSGVEKVIIPVFLLNLSLVRGWRAGFWNYEGQNSDVPVK